MQPSDLASRKAGYAVAGVLLLAAPVFFYPLLLMKVYCFALFACAFNLLIGFAGLVSFGHAAFFGGAAYIGGYALASLGWPVELALAAAALAAAAMGYVVGILAIRRKGVYFSMITLALAQMCYFFYLQAPFTGGEDGLQGIPRGRLFGVVDLSDDRVLYYVVLAIVVAGYALIVRVIHSPFGQVLKAIRENEARAVSLGYDVARYKLLAFVLSTGLSGLAGATKALALGFATLTDAHWSMSGMVILMTLIGGMGTFVGPVVGAFVILLLESKLDEIGNFLAALTHIEWFRSFGTSVTMVLGLVFMACVLAFRRGLVGELIRLRDRARAPAEARHG